MGAAALAHDVPSPASTQHRAGADPAAFVRTREGEDSLELLVQGAKCAGCIAKIERGLMALPGMRAARLNLSTGRLTARWTHGAVAPHVVVSTVADLGYGVSVFDPDASRKHVDAEGRRLLRAMAVAGFATMNIMMFSVPIWSGEAEMGDGTRTLLHWISAIIAMPAALYAGQPFFGSALNALRKGGANMDVPISLGVLLALSLSLYETATRGPHAYFDGACMLLFLLLIGRYLDHQLRERARTAARDLLARQAVSATRLDGQGLAAPAPARSLEIGDRVLVAPGERIPADGVVLEGVSELDRSMLTGESAPVAVQPGEAVHAGAVNLARALTVRVDARVEDSAVAALARLIEIGEQGRAGFVRMADRAARLYVPVVHTLAAATLIGWLVAPSFLARFGVDAPAIGLHGAALNAIAVLIITCPCALGLAAPAVQVVTTGRLFRNGVLIKSSDALERLAEADHVVLDKTGTLTLGRPQLISAHDHETLMAAAALARASRHPLSRALTAAAGPGAMAKDVTEVPGAGLAGAIDGQPARLGKRTFAAPQLADDGEGAAELWFAHGGRPPIRFVFEDALRRDAAQVVAALKSRGLEVELISGDREAAVAAAAKAVGITRWRANASPTDKTARLAALRAAGRKTLMIGDGLNDSAALAAAHASVSPGSAVDIAQAAADVVLQGELLMPIADAIDAAKSANARVIQNFGFSTLYNLIAVPVAVFGLVTPLIAALAMSGSSLAVTLNALRPQGSRSWAS